MTRDSEAGDPLGDVPAAERARLDASVAEIDAALAKSRMHPVVKDVLFLLHDEHGKWLQDFSLARLEQLQAVIVATEKPAAGSSLRLVDAVYDLFKAAAALWQVPAAKKPAQILYALLEKIIAEKNLMGVVSGDAELGARLAAAKQAIGDETRSNAPKLGEAPPEGSLRADKIIPKRRI